MGIKITDERGVRPITKKPFLVVDREEEDHDMYVKVQTKEVCCVMVIAYAKDNKHLYEEVFEEYYEWGENLRLVGLPESPLGPRLMPFNVSHTTDLKAAWYLSNRGGGCKTKTHFCHLCTCIKDTLTSFTVDDFRCERCKKRNRKKCYHHTVCDTVNAQKVLEVLETQLGDYYNKHGKTFHEISSATKLQIDHMQVDRETDINHIDYIIPVHDAEKQRQYTQFIARECNLHGLQLHGRQVEEWRTMLRSSIVVERLILILDKVRVWKAQGREGVALVEVVELLIPCILHLENRIGEKMITIILRKGLNDFRGSKEEYMKHMDELFKTKFLGSDASPLQWRLPFSKDLENNIVLNHIQLQNNVVRCIMKEMDVIVEKAWSLQNTEVRAQLIISILKYRDGMDLLTVHR